MLVSPKVIENLSIDAGEARRQKAKAYHEQGRVEITNVEYENSRNFEISGIVIGSESYKTYVSVHDGEVSDITCECQDYYHYYGVCKHTLATILAFSEDTKKEIKHTDKTTKVINPYRNFKQMVATFYQEEIEEMDQEEPIQGKQKGTIKLEPKIIYDKFLGSMKVEFKIGEKKMYKIKNLSEFYTRMLEKEDYQYGEKLKFTHTREMFEEQSQSLLDFILRYAEMIKYANSNANSHYRYYGKALSETCIVLGNSGMDDLFAVLDGRKVLLQRDYLTEEIELTQEQPNITFQLKKREDDQYVIIPNIDIFHVNIIKGKIYQYILDHEKLYRCTKEFEQTTLKLLMIFRQNYMTEVLLGKEELASLFSIVIPKVKDAIVVEGLTEEEIEQHQPKALEIKVYLDFDDNDFLVAGVNFIYDTNEFNPLNETLKLDFPRDMVKETRALNVFRKTGFMLDTKNLRFILPDNDKIYQFLTEDIQYYYEKFTILATEKFKTKQIRQPKIGGLGVKVENNLLVIDWNNIDIERKELVEIMSKYTLKKKYHRLKDGSFIHLEGNQDIDFLDKLVSGMDIDYQELEKEELRLPVNRTLYLNELLKGMKGTEIVKNGEYRKIVHELDKNQLEEMSVPKNLEGILRDYQKTGFQWLKVLDNYKFGGILADDMGLGKTLQMLSIVVDYVQNSRGSRTSLVVSPSSLTLNWQNEAKKFAQGLRTLVIRGNLAERKRQIEEMDQYDLVITSYDLLKRDIDLYEEKDYPFRYIIADEAQYLKNSHTQNAKSIKKIKADTRFALTGTPIENSLAELWSIFDFIMPGYLFTYKKFKTLYEVPIVKEENQEILYKLRMLIEPFVLRRNKKDVLTELPDKTVTILNNEMGEEQRNIYLNYLLQARQEIEEGIEIHGYERSQMQILTALTRLRQICCHPSLFIENYQEGSSKLDQCMEILQEAISGGHKILLFSGYTSMFNIIEKELKKTNIHYFTLTGSTKVEERVKLVDEFNQNPEVKIFLISLKAGGTGLNLTGADVVIHYDPWWNLSTENQATDRAYRIGQKNNVQVYKLITKNSIEEKINQLQQKKAELVDNMLSTKTAFINKFSKEEILQLFRE